MLAPRDVRHELADDAVPVRRQHDREITGFHRAHRGEQHFERMGL